MADQPVAAPPAAASRLMVQRAVGVCVVAGVSLATGLLALRYPEFTGFATALNTLVAWGVGKLLGVPLDGVLQSAVRAMSPSHAVALTVGAVQSMPTAVTQGVLGELAGHAVAALPAADAQQLTAQIMASVPPAAQARVMEHIVFVSQQGVAVRIESDDTEPDLPAADTRS